MVQLNGWDETRNPYTNMNINDIIKLPEAAYRQYMVFCTAEMSRDIKQIKNGLKEKPEIRRANLALILWGATVIITALTAVVALWP